MFLTHRGKILVLCYEHQNWLGVNPALDIQARSYGKQETENEEPL